LLFSLLLLSLAVPAVAADKPGADPFADPETRANALKEVSQHLICQCSCNMILSECSHQSCPFALPEREKILAALAAGKSGEEIVASYVAAYGPTIRATPPTVGSLYDRVAWFAPIGGLVLGLGIVVLYLARVTGRKPRPPAGDTTASPDLFRRRVEEDLARGESGGSSR
jgi:cytochrome c-type biogenesis protein CcmH/NrfF